MFVARDLKADDLIDNAERDKRVVVPQACIVELVAALRVTRRDSPWGHDIKVTDEFLDPLFENYFQRLGTSQQIFKRDYHGLADGIPLAQLDSEIVQHLDALVGAVARAIPAQGICFVLNAWLNCPICADQQAHNSTILPMTLG